MPELDDTHAIPRLQKRIAELEAGNEIAKRDVYAVLNEQQQQELEFELAAQQALKKQGRARTDEARRALGWKTIREVRIEVLKRALAQAETNELVALKRKLHDAEVRRARIYMQAFGEARKAGRAAYVAHTWANNELTRAALPRMDRGVVGAKHARDKAVWELEEGLRQQARAEMPAHELEQLKWLEAHQKEVASRRKSRKEPTD